MSDLKAYRKKKAREDRGDPDSIKTLIKHLSTLIDDVMQFEEKFDHRISESHPAYESSARNLIHYIAVRRNDIRSLQERLSTLGLSSLGRSESHVMSSLNAVLKMLHKAAGEVWQEPATYRRVLPHGDGVSLIETHAESLLGMRPRGRKVRIMVTMPTEAATDYPYVRSLIKSGMDCARINCAHDDAAAWARMARNIRKAEKELGRPCRILMDLSGPKLRTGDLLPGPRVVRLRVRKDVTGKPVALGRVWLTDADHPEEPSEAIPVLPIRGGFLSAVGQGDELRIDDLRGKTRVMIVRQKSGRSATAEFAQNIYVGTGAEIVRVSKDKESREGGHIGELPETVAPILLSYGDKIVLTASSEPGVPAALDEAGKTVSPARISCTLPAIFSDVKPEERILIDDGTIGGVIEEVSPERMTVRIVRAKPSGSKLMGDKGINLPDSDLRIKGLTEKDIEDLSFIVKHADLAALSFVRGPEDVFELHTHLRRLGARNLGIVLKIETRKALEKLPAILLEAMRGHPVGIMIARGDLAVECGFERLAEAQEDILMICEASHIPVIWATQVLENLTKQGLPSRAEITDAAMSVRAECVMLNKGPYILESLRVLDDILQRMGEHQQKNASLWGRLNVSEIEV